VTSVWMETWPKLNISKREWGELQTIHLHSCRLSQLLSSGIIQGVLSISFIFPKQLISSHVGDLFRQVNDLAFVSCRTTERLQYRAYKLQASSPANSHSSSVLFDTSHLLQHQFEVGKGCFCLQSLTHNV